MPDTAPAMVRQGRGLISCSTEFINGCGIEPPFYLVFISTNGSVIVTHWSAVGEVHDVCERLHEIAVLPIVWPSFHWTVVVHPRASWEAITDCDCFSNCGRSRGQGQRIPDLIPPLANHGAEAIVMPALAVR